MKAARRADLVLLAHLLAAAFGLFGGFLVPWQRGWMWVHAPVALWFALVNLADWTCPFTTLERQLREENDGGGYQGGFLEHYLGRHVGKHVARRQMERTVGLVFLGWNALIYAWILAG